MAAKDDGTRTEGSAAPPAEGTTLRSRLRAALRSPARRWVVAGGLGTAAVLGLALMVALGRGPSDVDRTRDLVTRLAAKDPGTAELLSDPDDLGPVASSLGLAGLPGSVSVAMEDFEGQGVADLADVQIQVPGASAAYMAPASGPGVEATYTLVLTGPDGTLGRFDQKIWVKVWDDEDYHTLLGLVGVEGRIYFNLADYFGTDGTTTEAVDLVTQDLRDGNEWLPQVEVGATSTDSTITVPDDVTIVPTHLTTWSKVISEADPGTEAIWTVQVSLAGNLGTDVINQVSPAKVVTKEPVAARVSVGGLEPTDAISQALEVAEDYNAAVESGDAAAANLVMRNSKFDITASGLAYTKAMGWTCSLDEPQAEDNGMRVVVSFGSCKVSLARDGSWSIDGLEDREVAAVVAGNGKKATLYGAQYLPGAPFPSCTNRITIKLVRVTFYTDGTVTATFNFRYSNEANCSVGDHVTKATVGWKGNKGVSIGLYMSGESEAVMELPEGVTPTSTPIWIKFTRYETRSGSALPYTLTFYTK
jgi:hypothetical protein